VNQSTAGIGDDEVVVADQPDRPDESVDVKAAPDGVAGSVEAGDADRPEDEAEQAADTFLADLQRVSAEFANYRRQTEKRHSEFVKQAGSRLALQLLPVLDALDAAMAHQTEGVEPIRAQLLSVLEREGLELIGSESEQFDPSRHEAAMHEPADDNDDAPIVSEVLRPGYAWNGRVLRAAMVKVKG